MRRVRRIISTERIIPIIKESQNGTTIIKKGHNDNHLVGIKATNKNVPIVNYTEAAGTLPKNIKNKNVFKIEPIWAGETVYIIGGGPSLINFDWTRLGGKKTIAINKSILSYPNANILYWTDSRVYGWYKTEIDKFKGLKITIRDHVTYPDDVKILRKSSKFGLEESRDSLCHGNNSGYAAINLAYHLGVKKIVLLGYDMKNNGTQGHYHDGYPVPVTGDGVYKDQFIPGFKILADLLKEKKIEVYNASLSSALTVWPKISIDQALSFR